MLYRGIKGWELDQFMGLHGGQGKNKVTKNTLSSFSKSLNVASGFGGGYVLVLDQNGEKIPAVNFTSGNFQSEWAKGGKKYTNANDDEREVLLPPGTFTVQDIFYDYWKNIWRIVVKFEATPRNTSYLHRAPQVRVPTPPRIYTGIRGGLYTLAANGKTKKYLKKSATKK